MNTTIQTRKLPTWIGHAAVKYFREHGTSSRNVSMFLRTIPIKLEACTTRRDGQINILIARCGNNPTDTNDDFWAEPDDYEHGLADYEAP